MKDNKGFTLVELLAVIAILAILVIIALPNVMSMFNQAKENSFKTEIKEIYKVAQQTWISDSMFDTKEKAYARTSSGCANQLDLTGRQELEYFIKISKNGNVISYYATDGTYQYSYNGMGLKIEDIENVDQISNTDSNRTVKVTCNSAKISSPPPISNDYYLMSAGNITGTNQSFLRTTIVRENIEKVTFTDSIDGHTPNNTDCFDVSKGRNGSILAWVEDNDNDGVYEITVGTNGDIYLSDGKYLFAQMNKLEKIEGLEFLNTSQVDNMFGMFVRCFVLSELDLSSFDTSQVINMSQMFGACFELKKLNISSWDTSKVKNMSSMFSNCSKLTSLDLSNFNTNSVTDMGAMFQGCSSLISLNISNFNTSNVETFNGLEISRNSGNYIDNGMFQGCGKLTSLDLSHFNTSNVKDMNRMFQGCTDLTVLNVSNFNTSKVIKMESMFSYLYNIEKLDLSSFNTSKVTNMKDMFRASKFKTIYTSNNFTTDAVTRSDGMFYGNTNLIGGSGTVFNSSHITAAYAHIDGGTSNPGYFTLK